MAHAILQCAERPTRDVVVGGSARLQIAMRTVAPRLADLVMQKQMMTGQKRDTQPNSDDSLYRTSSEPSGIHGDHPGYVMRTSAYTRAVLSDAARALPVLAIGALLAGVAIARR